MGIFLKIEIASFWRKHPLIMERNLQGTSSWKEHLFGKRGRELANFSRTQRDVVS